jgi:hypothetical protein
MNTARDFEETKKQKRDTQTSSPWTEPFQQSCADAPATSQDQQPQAKRPGKADHDHPTHDALSAIFNGD